MKKTLVITVCGAVLNAHSANFPEPAAADPRIRYVNYVKDDVTTVTVQRGTVTRIVLASDEKILKDGSATGFPADCSKPELEWCIHALPGANQVLVKPMDGATHNNLELKTNLRDYSFAFRVLADAKRRRPGVMMKGSQGDTPTYRVVFRYQPRLAPLFATLAVTNESRPPESKLAVRKLLADARPQPKNWNYSIQIGPQSADIAPSLIFDDGRFTYLRFPANREIPTIYAISPHGEESRVNFHIDPGDRSLTVVEKMSRRFVLRLGTSAVGIWNDTFDPDGVPPRDGTTVTGVARVLREGK